MGPGSGTTMDRNTYWQKFYNAYAVGEPGPLETGSYSGPNIDGGVHWYNIIYDLVERQGADIMDPKNPGSRCLWSDKSTGGGGPSEACGYPQFLSVDSIINAFIDFGVPPAKLIMGAAHYGRAFRNVQDNHPTPGDHNDHGYNSVFNEMCAWDYYDCDRDSTGARMDPPPTTGDAYCMGWASNEAMSPIPCKVEGFMSKWNITEEPRFVAYKDVVRILADYDDFEYFFDESALAPFVWNEQDKIFITYDDERSIRHKAEYVNQRELGGLMYWQMGQDTDDLKLTQTMDDTLLDGKVRLGYWLLDPNDDVEDGRNVPPEDIPWSLLNRVHLSFFNIEGDDNNMGDAPYEVKVPRAIRNEPETYAGWADQVIRMFRERQSQNPDCEIAIAIGGWALGNRNGPDAYAYSAMLRTPESRRAVIDSAIDILTMEFIKRDFPQYADEIESNNYKFEIFDMDWEYPGQETNDKIWDAELGAPIDCFHTPQGMMGDLSGCKWGDNVVREDVQGLTTLLREFKAATNGEYKRTIASAGAIYSMSFILQDLTEFVAELESVNVMTYDYAGPWLQRPPTDPANGYGNQGCNFNSGGWTWWLCAGGYGGGATTAHHTNLYPAIRGLSSLACDDVDAPNRPGCWDGVRDPAPAGGTFNSGAWMTSRWTADTDQACESDDYGHFMWQSQQQCLDYHGL
jgi:GH18 family chitinase